MSKIEKTVESAISDFFTAKSKDLFCVCDANFVIRNINESFINHLGKTGDDLLNTNLITLIDDKVLKTNFLSFLLIV